MKTRIADVAASRRRVSGELIAGAALLGLAAIATTAIQLTTGPLSAGWTEIVRIAINGEIWSFALLGCVLVADDRVDRGGSRLRAYGIAVVAAALIGILLGAVQTHFVWDAFRNPSAPVQAKIQLNPWVRYTQQLYLVIEALLIGGLATYLYADRREMQKMAQRLHDANVRRTAQAKKMLESELQAMQARVEPRFLLNTLAEVQSLYKHDAGAGDRMLDDLIVYLRAAMPKLRDTASTLGEEMRLARAYLDIVKVRFGDRLTFSIRTPADHADVRCPPMLVLPLVNHAMRRDRAEADVSIHITAELHPDAVRVCLRHSGNAFAAECADGEIGDIRERLDALYASGASLVLRSCGDAGSEALLELPVERHDGQIAAVGTRWRSIQYAHATSSQPASDEIASAFSFGGGGPNTAPR